jgi:hypothetical protein
LNCRIQHVYRRRLLLLRVQGYKRNDSEDHPLSGRATAGSSSSTAHTLQSQTSPTSPVPMPRLGQYVVPSSSVSSMLQRPIHSRMCSVLPVMRRPLPSRIDHCSMDHVTGGHCLHDLECQHAALNVMRGYLNLLTPPSPVTHFTQAGCHLLTACSAQIKT